MSKLRAVALLCSGPVSRSAVTRLPNLRRYLTWVKSSSFHASSRAVNALGAGVPVSACERGEEGRYLGCECCRGPICRPL